jgi:acetyl esterase/lipase
MKKLFAILVGAVLLLCFNGQMRQANTSGINNKYLDLPYASESKSQKLDIYLPDTSDQPFPIIVSIHGGAFMSGDKRDGQLNPMLEGIKRGYAVISINYRLSKEAKFPAQIQDIKAAIRWIKANAKKYNKILIKSDYGVARLVVIWHH